MGRRGWAAAPEGWVQIIRGPRPPAVRWPKADPWPVVGRSLSDAKPKPVSRTIPHGRQERPTKSPEIVLEEAKKKVAGIEAALAALASVGATEGPEVQFLKESLQKAKRASQEPPIAVQVSQTEAFVERARKRLAAHDVEREALVNELEASQSRLVRLRSLAEVAQNVPSPQPVLEVDSEIAALIAKLASMEEERDVRGRRPKRQAVAQADAGFIPAQDLPPMPTCRVPAELDRWMHHCHLELREAMEFGDNSTVLELSSKLSDAAVLMSESTGTMMP